MAFPSGTAYHADSDADDEYERSVMTSPTQLHTDSEASPSDSEPPSAEHTPTTYGHSGEDRSTPRTIITEWTAEESADFVAGLGLRQYCDAFLENEIVGEALIALKHDELKEMGIASVGHRLTILKGVYEIKMSQDIPIDSDHYVPLTEQSRQNEVATQEDVQRIIQSLRLRDARIIQAEAELRRLTEDYRRLREELLPVFRMAKDHSQPLPYGPPYSSSVTSPELYNHNLTSPPAAQNVNEKSGTSLGRSLSKKLFLGSTPKNNSPTHIPNTIHEGRALDGRNLTDNTSLDPSAAATAASNHLTAQMSGGLSAASLPNTSPSSIPVPSPTSPAPYPAQTLASKSYNRDGNTSAPTTSRSLYDTHNDEPVRSNTTPQPIQNGPSSASKMNSQNPSLSASGSSIIPSTKDRDRDRDRDRAANSSTAPSSAGPQSASDSNANSVEIFKSFRVGLEDPCYKVLPAALRKYNIQADWRQYALYIVFGDQERCVGLEEKPLSLFKQYDKEGKKPMFMLRKLAQPFDGQGDGVGGSTTGGGGGAGLGVGGLRDVSSASSLRGPVQPFNLPGGVV
ncbi:MAG: hypothetical protein Q9227_009108 [Pyrenula ochraceoflavens]